MLCIVMKTLLNIFCHRQTAMVMLNISLLLIPRPILSQVYANHKRSRFIPEDLTRHFSLPKLILSLVYANRKRSIFWDEKFDGILAQFSGRNS